MSLQWKSLHERGVFVDAVGNSKWNFTQYILGKRVANCSQSQFAPIDICLMATGESAVTRRGGGGGHSRREKSTNESPT